MTRSLLFAVLLSATSLSVGAMAAEPSADALIEQGLGLRRDGKPEQALEMFRQAHAVAPSPRTFGQMGLVETSLKRWVDGENHLAVSLANPDDRWVAKNRAFLDEALGLCRRHVGDLIVTGPAGTEVFVGGQSVGTLPAVPALRLTEGAVTVTANAPGSQPFERTVTVRPGARTTLPIALAPIIATPIAPPAAPVPAPAPAPLIATEPATHGESGPSNWHTWAGISLAVAGAAAIGWGIYWIAIDNDQTGQLDSTGKPLLYATRTPGLIIAGAGAAALVGGAVVYLISRRPTDPTIAVGLTPGAVLLRGTF